MIKIRTMIDKSKFPLYGYISSAIALILFIFPILDLINRCPFGFGNVMKISIIQFVFAIFAFYFGCCSETKGGKTSKYLGLCIIIILTSYYIIVVMPCIINI